MARPLVRTRLSSQAMKPLRVFTLRASILRAGALAMPKTFIKCAKCTSNLEFAGMSASLRDRASRADAVAMAAINLGWQPFGQEWRCPSHHAEGDKFNPDYCSARPRTDRHGRPLRDPREMRTNAQCPACDGDGVIDGSDVEWPRTCPICVGEGFIK